MRLSILDRGHDVWTKVLFAIIRAFSRQPVLDAVKLAMYRRDFYGGPMGKVTQEAMRGPSRWTVGDRELMAALVAKTNRNDWCTLAHSAVARAAGGDAADVSAVLSNLDGAPASEPLRSTLRMLQKLTRENAVDVEDMRALLAAGVSPEEIEDALAVCFAFNVVSRLSNAFAFEMPSSDAMDAGAKYLLARGYR